MVPGHPFNEMKPNSGAAPAKPGLFKREVRGLRRDASETVSDPTIGAKNTDLPGSSSDRSFVTDKTSEPIAHLGRVVEAVGDALCAPAYRKRQAAKIRHDGKHTLVGDVVTDKDRAAPLERFVVHQFDDARRLVEAGMLDLADAFAGQHFDRRVGQIGPD